MKRYWHIIRVPFSCQQLVLLVIITCDQNVFHCAAILVYRFPSSIARFPKQRRSWKISSFTLSRIWSNFAKRQNYSLALSPSPGSNAMLYFSQCITHFPFPYFQLFFFLSICLCVFSQTVPPFGGIPDLAMVLVQVAKNMSLTNASPLVPHSSRTQR